MLVAVHLKKTPCKVCYQSQRITETDFPVLTCAVSRQESGWVFAIGARPSIAKRIENTLPMRPPRTKSPRLWHMPTKRCPLTATCAAAKNTAVI